TGADLCMHAGFGPVRVSQTTGSMVVVQDNEDLIVWVTGSAAPCLSIFKPMVFQQTENHFGSQPQLDYDPHSYWWQQERIHRSIIKDYQRLSHDYQKERDVLENSFILEMEATENNLETIQNCFERSLEFQRTWIEKIEKEKMNDKTNFLHSMFWKKNNRLAKIPIE
ncbi:MAG TPA: hypothetical protein VK856_07005, partial [Anaerolineaceae bacterium]|nr:hypothetical protein [Anaerolineaceae bacterium]